MLPWEGREDMDVRMLGMGRPFVLEVSNARAAMPSKEIFAELQQKLADASVGVEVRKLQPVGKDKLQLIKARCFVAVARSPPSKAVP